MITKEDIMSILAKMDYQTVTEESQEVYTMLMHLLDKVK